MPARRWVRRQRTVSICVLCRRCLSSERLQSTVFNGCCFMASSYCGVGVGWGGAITSKRTSMDMSCYATGRSLALVHPRHATILDVLLHYRRWTMKSKPLLYCCQPPYPQISMLPLGCALGSGGQKNQTLNTEAAR